MWRLALLLPDTYILIGLQVTVSRVQSKFKAKDAPAPSVSLETGAITKEQVSLIDKGMKTRR